MLSSWVAMVICSIRRVPTFDLLRCTLP